MSGSFTGHISYIYSVYFSPDGRFTLSGSDDKTIRLMDVSTGSLLKTFKNHTALVYSVCVSLDGKYLISTSEDETLKIREVDSVEKILTIIRKRFFY
jgi:WD40 repeat protein